MKKNASRLLIGLLTLSLLLPARAEVVATVAVSDQPVAVEGGSSEEVQPKFFLFGFLLNVALKFAISSFREWRQQKLTSEVSEPINYKKLLRNSALSSLVSTAGGALFPMFSFKSADSGEAVAAPAKQPARTENRLADFQGAHVAVVGFDAAGNVTGLRPLNGAFRTGERVKLKVVSTFDAWFVIENINAAGVRQQIFPRDANQAVLLKAGNEILVPMVEDQYFEFAGQTGKEQLVLTLRDPKTVTGPASDAEVVRQDEGDGLGLLQEVKPGTYPAITQALWLNHER